MYYIDLKDSDILKLKISSQERTFSFTDNVLCVPITSNYCFNIVDSNGGYVKRCKISDIMYNCLNLILIGFNAFIYKMDTPSLSAQRYLAKDRNCLKDYYSECASILYWGAESIGTLISGSVVALGSNLESILVADSLSINTFEGNGQVGIVKELKLYTNGKLMDSDYVTVYTTGDNLLSLDYLMKDDYALSLLNKMKRR